MPYILETVEYRNGAIKDIRKYFSANFGKKLPKSPRSGVSSEAMKRVNREHAIRTLEGDIIENFDENDVFVALTYGSMNPVPDEERARKDIEDFQRKARRFFAKQGEEHKYIHVPEYSGRRPHHHVIMKGIKPGDLKKLWPHGNVRITPLWGKGDYRKLAEYLVNRAEEEALRSGKTNQKRWNSSKNLKKPKTTKEVIESKSWRSMPKAPKEYYIEGNNVENRINEFDGRPMQFYRLMRLEGKNHDNVKASTGGKGRSNPPPAS